MLRMLGLIVLDQELDGVDYLLFDLLDLFMHRGSLMGIHVLQLM